MHRPPLQVYTKMSEIQFQFDCYPISGQISENVFILVPPRHAVMNVRQITSQRMPVCVCVLGMSSTQSVTNSQIYVGIKQYQINQINKGIKLQQQGDVLLKGF